MSTSLLYLMLGWLLGLLSPLIVDKFKRWRDTGDLRKALRIELEDLRYRLSAMVYDPGDHYGTLTRDKLTWVMDTLGDYDRDPDAQRTVSSIERMLQYSDRGLATVAAQRSQAMIGRAIWFRKLEVPLLELTFDRVLHFKSKTQYQLVDLRANLRILNGMVDEAEYYYKLTFDQSLGAPDRDSINANLQTAHSGIEDRANMVADRIGRIELV